MISLELKFVDGAGGFTAACGGPLTYVQVARTDKTAVYQRFYPDGRAKDFEVFRIKIDPKGKVQKFPDVIKKDADGKVISCTPGLVKVIQDDTEKYPSTGQFGFIAWSFHNKGAAMTRYEKLCKEADGIEDAPPDMVEPEVVVGETPTPKPPKEVKALLVPVGEFSTTQLAASNGVEYPIASNFIKFALEQKKIQLVRKEKTPGKKGPGTNIYSKIA